MVDGGAKAGPGRESALSLQADELLQVAIRRGAKLSLTDNLRLAFGDRRRSILRLVILAFIVTGLLYFAGGTFGTSVVTSLIASLILMVVDAAFPARSATGALELALRTDALEKQATRETTLAESLRRTIRDVLLHDLQGLDAARIGLIVKNQGLPPDELSKLLASTVQARERLSRALGRLEQVVPAGAEDIELPKEKR